MFQIKPLFAPVGLLVATVMMSPATSGYAAAKSISPGDPVPTQIVGEIVPTQRPVPICRRCQVLTTVSDQGAAELALAYFDQQFPMFEGRIDITVALYDGREAAISVEAVALLDGDSALYSLEPGPDWTWDDVVYVWVEMVPD